MSDQQQDINWEFPKIDASYDMLKNLVRSRPGFVKLWNDTSQLPKEVVLENAKQALELGRIDYAIIGLIHVYSKHGNS